MVTLIAQTAESVLMESPVTTAGIFVLLTSAIAYLYRARDKDRVSEVTRLERQIERLEEVIDLLRRELGDR
jgi:hypothetical protein